MRSSNVAEILRENCLHQEHKTALAWPSADGASFDAISYGAFEAESDQQARQLTAEGIRPGDKVVFLVTPGRDMYSLIFALYKIGAVPVLVDPGMGLKRMLHCYRSVGARGFVGVPIAALIKACAPRFFRSIDISITIRDGVLYSGIKKLAPSLSREPFPIHQAKPSDLLHIAFTTGSTGPAKAVECTHGMALAMKNIIVERYAYTPDDIELITIPFIGVLTLLLGNTGVMPVMQASKPAKVNPRHIIDAIEQFKVTCMTASPALLNVLGRHAEIRPFKLPTIRFISAGGAPTSVRTMRNILGTLSPSARFEITWGATEALPLAAMSVRSILTTPELSPTEGKGSCLGMPMPGVRVGIIERTQGPIQGFNSGSFLKPGDVGEILVSGPNVSPAYHQDPESNALHKVHDGHNVWHRTGDLGWLDDTGRIWFCGRLSEAVFPTGSTKPLYTVQCEGIVNAVDGVSRSALVTAKVPSATGHPSNLPVLFVEIDPSYQINRSEQEATDIQEAVRVALKGHPLTQPIQCVLFHPGFPVDIRHNAKIDRRALGELASRLLTENPLHRGYAFPRRSFSLNPMMLIPVLGWLFIAYGLVFPIDNIYLQIAWWIDVFLSVVVHIAQIPLASQKASLHGYSANATRWLTIIFGATWWKAL